MHCSSLEGFVWEVAVQMLLNPATLRQVHFSRAVAVMVEQGR
jgi:hypothetical protein